MHKPPCDEAVILTGGSGRSTPGCGPWVLVATILGSSLAFIDGTVVNVALPAMQSSLGADLAGRAVGRRGLRAHARRAAPDRRLPRRPVWPPPGFRRWASLFSRRLRPRADSRARSLKSLRPAPCRDSARRFSSREAWRSSARLFLAERSRTCDWNLVGVHVDHRRARPGASAAGSSNTPRGTGCSSSTFPWRRS